MLTNFYLLLVTITLIIKFFAVIYMSPIFLVPGVVVAAIGGWLGNVYIAAQASAHIPQS